MLTILFQHSQMSREVGGASTETRDNCSFLRSGLKHEIDRPRFASGDGDFLPLSPIGLMPCSDRIFAGRKFRQLELAVLSGNSKVPGFQNDKIGLHPSVNIALYGDEFFFVVRVGEWRGASRLNPVPLAVDLG
jgi:hypothetical protein